MDSKKNKELFTIHIRLRGCNVSSLYPVNRLRYGKLLFLTGNKKQGIRRLAKAYASGQAAVLAENVSVEETLFSETEVIGLRTRILHEDPYWSILCS